MAHRKMELVSAVVRNMNHSQLIPSPSLAQLVFPAMADKNLQHKAEYKKMWHRSSPLNANRDSLAARMKCDVVKSIFLIKQAARDSTFRLSTFAIIPWFQFPLNLDSRAWMKSALDRSNRRRVLNTSSEARLLALWNNANSPSFIQLLVLRLRLSNIKSRASHDNVNRNFILFIIFQHMAWGYKVSQHAPLAQQGVAIKIDCVRFDSDDLQSFLL